MLIHTNSHKLLTLITTTLIRRLCKPTMCKAAKETLRKIPSSQVDAVLAGGDARQEAAAKSSRQYLFTE